MYISRPKITVALTDHLLRLLIILVTLHDPEVDRGQQLLLLPRHAPITTLPLVARYSLLRSSNMTLFFGLFPIPLLPVASSLRLPTILKIDRCGVLSRRGAEIVSVLAGGPLLLRLLVGGPVLLRLLAGGPLLLRLLSVHMLCQVACSVSCRWVSELAVAVPPVLLLVEAAFVGAWLLAGVKWRVLAGVLALNHVVIIVVVTVDF